MPKLSDLKIDEVSLVRKGANQHAKVAIAKSIEGGGDVEIYDQEGTPIDPESLEDGDIVFDQTGNAYQYSLDAEEGLYDDDEDEDEPDFADTDENEYEFSSVGKAASFSQRPRSGIRKQFEEEFSKALTDEQRDTAIAKAVGYMDHLEEVAQRAQDVALSEREARRDAEFYEVAKSYSLPVSTDELAQAIKAVVDNLNPADVETIQKCFQFASESAMFDEIGNVGGGDNSDVMATLEASVSGSVSKGDFSREELLSKTFELDPDAYDLYLAEQQTR